MNIVESSLIKLIQKIYETYYSYDILATKMLSSYKANCINRKEYLLEQIIKLEKYLTKKNYNFSIPYGVKLNLDSNTSKKAILAAIKLEQNLCIYYRKIIETTSSMSIKKITLHGLMAAAKTQTSWETIGNVETLINPFPGGEY